MFALQLGVGGRWGELSVIGLSSSEVSTSATEMTQSGPVLITPIKQSCDNVKVNK